jgi:AcrR family transcriptional regulator
MTQAPAPSRPAARERILEAASRLFVRDGFRAVGVDTVIAEAGVAKMTLYAHFPSKDDLIAAYLERANERFWHWLDAAVADVDDPKERLVAMFDAVGKLANGPQCLGCTFQGTAAEFPNPDHPGHRVARAHKQAVLARLHTLAQEADLRDPEALADQLLLLMDGAWVAARMFGPGNPSAQVAAAATALIDAHSRPKPAVVE